MFAQIDLTVFDKGAGDNADNPCELIMAAPEGGEAAADGLSNGLPPAGCIPLWLAWEARLIHKDEKARFDRLVEYFLQSPDTSGVPEGSTLGYVDRDGGCAVSSIVACALATEFKGVVGGSWKPQAALSVSEGACPRTAKRYTVQSFHTGAISLRKAVADMVSTSTSEQKAEWFSFLGPLYEAKKIGAVSGSQHANVDLQSATDVIDLFTSDFRKKSEHVGELGLALIALVIGRAIRAHTAPLTGPQRFTDYGEGAPFIHIVIIGEHYYPVLPRGRLPNQAAVSMCATTVVPCKSTAVEPLSESTAVAELANLDAAGPKEVEKSPADEAKTSNSAGGSPPISPNQAAESMCATTVVSCKSTAVEPLSESTAVAVLANVDAAGPKEVEKLPAEEAKTSNSAGGSPPISGAGSPSRADIKSTAVVARLHLMRTAHSAALKVPRGEWDEKKASSGDVLGEMLKLAKSVGAIMAHDGLTKDKAIATAKNIVKATYISAFPILLPEYFSLAVAETEALVSEKLTPGASNMNGRALFVDKGFHSTGAACGLENVSILSGAESRDFLFDAILHWSVFDECGALSTKCNDALSRLDALAWGAAEHHKGGQMWSGPTQFQKFTEQTAQTFISVMMMKLQAPGAKWVISSTNIVNYVAFAADELPTVKDSVDKTIVVYFMLIYRINALKHVLSSPTGLGIGTAPTVYAPWLCFLLNNVQNPARVTMANTDVVSITVSQLMDVLSTGPNVTSDALVESLKNNFTKMKGRLSQLVDWSQTWGIINNAAISGAKLTFIQVKELGLSELLNSGTNGMPHTYSTYTNDADDILLRATKLFSVEFEILEELKAKYIGLCDRVSTGDVAITFTSLLAVANRYIDKYLELTAFWVSMKKFGLTTYKIDDMATCPVHNFVAADGCETVFHECASALAEKLGVESKVPYEMWGEPEFLTSGEGSFLTAAIKHTPALVAHVATRLLIPGGLHCTIVTTNNQPAGGSNVLNESWCDEKGAALGQPAHSGMPHDGQIFKWAALLPKMNDHGVIVFNTILSSTSTLQLDSISRLVGMNSQLPLRPAVAALCECMFIAVSGDSSRAAGLESETAHLQARTKAVFGSLGADVDARTRTAADVFKGQATLMYEITNDRRFKMFGCVLMMMLNILIVHDYVCTIMDETAGFLRLRTAIEHNIGSTAERGREHFLSNCLVASEMATAGSNPIQNVPVRHFDAAISASARYAGRGEFMRYLLQTRAFLDALREYKERVRVITVRSRLTAKTNGTESADSQTQLALTKQAILDAGEHVIAAGFIHLEPALEYERTGSTAATKSKVWEILAHSGKVAILSGASQISCDVCNTPIDDGETRISSVVGFKTGTSDKVHDVCQRCYNQLFQVGNGDDMGEALSCQEHSTYAHAITNGSLGNIANSTKNIGEGGAAAATCVAPATGNSAPASTAGKTANITHAPPVTTAQAGASADPKTTKSKKKKRARGKGKEKNTRKRKKRDGGSSIGEVHTTKRRKAAECDYNQCNQDCTDYAECVCCDRKICVGVDKFAAPGSRLYICNDEATNCDLTVQGFHYHSVDSEKPDMLVSVTTPGEELETLLPEPDVDIFEEGEHDVQNVGTKVHNVIERGIAEIYRVNLVHQRKRNSDLSEQQNIKRLKQSVIVAGLESELIKTTERMAQLNKAIAGYKSGLVICDDAAGSSDDPKEG